MKVQRNKYKMLFSNLFYFFICTVSVKIIGYILLPIFTSSMTTHEYGIADILMSTQNLIYPIIALGISGAVMRFAMDQESDVKLVFSSGIIILTLSTLISFLTIPVIRAFPVYAEFAVFVPIGVLLINYTNIISSLCKALNKTRIIVYQNVAYGICLLLSAIVFVKVLGLGVIGYLLSYLIAHVISIIILSGAVSIRSYISFSYKWREIKSEIKRILKYGVPLVPNSLAWWITQMSDRYMVTYWYGTTINGLYSVAYKIPSIINAGVNVFIQAWQLSAIHEYKEKNSSEFYNAIYKYYSAFCYILTACIVTCVQLLAAILFANDFYLAWRYVPLLLVAAAVGSQESFFGTFYLADNRTNRYFISSMIGAILNVILNLLLIPRFEVFGATIATLVSYFVIYIQRAFDIKKNIDINIHLFKNVASILILIMQSLIYCNSITTGFIRYSVCILSIITILILYFKELREMFFRILKFFHFGNMK
ncbi:MAG: oligosaccharide flippase family protein [Lachnospiraceae bacterium]